MNAKSVKNLITNKVAQCMQMETYQVLKSRSGSSTPSVFNDNDRGSSVGRLDWPLGSAITVLIDQALIDHHSLRDKWHAGY
jgi:hypothetical protein